MTSKAAISTPAEEQFLSKAELALRLKKTERTIDHWMRRGWLPYYKIGRCVRFKWSEVEAQLQKNCRICSIAPSSSSV
jgi:excisionase family DNA binding protein